MQRWGQRWNQGPPKNGGLGRSGAVSLTRERLGLVRGGLDPSNAGSWAKSCDLSRRSTYSSGELRDHIPCCGPKQYDGPVLANETSGDPSSCPSQSTSMMHTSSMSHPLQSRRQRGSAHSDACGGEVRRGWWNCRAGLLAGRAPPRSLGYPEVGCSSCRQRG